MFFPLAVSAVLFAAPANTLPCKLTAGDYTALAHAVKVPKDRATVDALTGKDAENLCKARAFVRKVRTLSKKQSGTLTDAEVERITPSFKVDEIAVGTMRFVDADENELIKPIVVQLLAAAFSDKLVPSDKPLAPAPECPITSLTDADYDSLAHVATPFTRESVAALPASDQKNLCLGRRLLRLARENDEPPLSHLGLNDIPPALSRYLTDDEYKIASPLVSRIMAADAAAAAAARKPATP